MTILKLKKQIKITYLESNINTIFTKVRFNLKKHFSILIACLLMLTNTFTVWGKMIPVVPQHTSNYNLWVSHNETRHRSLNRSETMDETTFFNLQSDDLLNYDNIRMEYGTFVNCEEGMIETLLDNHIKVLVDTNNIAHLKQILQHFKLETENLTNDPDRIGIYLFNDDGKYSYCDVNKQKVSFQDDEISKETDNDYDILTDLNEFVERVTDDKFKNLQEDKIENSIGLRQLPSGNFYKTSYSFTYLWWGSTGTNTVGSAQVAQYVYRVCKYKENGVLKSVDDIVTDVSINPYADYWVDRFTVDMESVPTYLDIIGQTNLQSNTSKSVGLSGGFSVSSQGIVSGSATKTTSFTSDIDGMNVTNLFGQKRKKQWLLAPTTTRLGQARNVNTGIRLQNHRAATASSQCRTRVSEIVLFKGTKWALWENIGTIINYWK